VIWAEYAIDTARRRARARHRTVAVTAGYITPQARGEFFAHMDAANVDLKAFTDDLLPQADPPGSPVLDTCAG
jgi:pyruvate-formate lyase-activating enzyme